MVTKQQLGLCTRHENGQKCGKDCPGKKVIENSVFGGYAPSEFVKNPGPYHKGEYGVSFFIMYFCIFSQTYYNRY